MAAATLNRGTLPRSRSAAPTPGEEKPSAGAMLEPAALAAAALVGARLLNLVMHAVG